MYIYTPYIPLSNQLPSNLGPPSNLGLQSPPFQSLNITYPLFPETFLMVRWMRGTFDFDQTYKQKVKCK